MPHDDPYRLTGPDGEVRPASPPRAGRAALWVLLVLSAAANSVTSVAGVSTAVSLACGVVTAACAAGLVVLWRRGRR